MKNLSYAVCADALICKGNLNVYYVTLTRLKDKVCLIYPSEDVKVIKMCESVFKGSICGDYYLRPRMYLVKNLKAVLRNKIMQEISHSVFCDLNAHVFCDLNAHVFCDLNATFSRMKLLMKICTHPNLQKKS